MKKWQYFELIAYYHRSFIAAIDQNRSVEMAIATTFESYFFYPEEENLISNLISNIQNINIQASLLKSVNKGAIDLFENQILSITDEMLNNALEEDEIEHLKEDIEELKYKLKNIKIV